MQSRTETRTRKSSTWSRTAAILASAQAQLDALVVDGELPAERTAARQLRLVDVLICLFAAAVACAALTRFAEAAAPGTQLEELSTGRVKYQYFARHKDEFDAVFLGTSRVYREFMPTVFDRALERRGHQLKSFNFGLRAMRHPEMRFTVDWILRRKPERLKWMFIELTPEIIDAAGVRLHEESPFSARVINWHDAAITWMLCRAVLASDLPFSEKIGAIRSHLHQFAYKFTNMGVGLSVAGHLLGYDRSAPPPDYRTTGYVPFLAEGDPKLMISNEIFLGQPEVLGDELRRLKERLPATTPDPYLMASLRWVVDRIRSAGAEPVFVILPPRWEPGVEMFDEEHTFGLPVVFAYDDPDRYPEFYALENLFNINHLNENGARILSRTFARDFSSFLESR